MLTLLLSGCDKADIAGMFLSDESVNQRFEQSMEWNTNNGYRNITVSEDNYIILTMSDSHVGGTRNLDSFLNRAKNINAAAVVMVGDLTTGHAKDYAVLEEHIPNPDSLPSFLVAGNHELYFDGWSEFYSRFGSSSYYFSVQTPVASDLFICLDTGGGTLGSKQLDWLKDILSSIRPDYRHCVILTHNNLFRLRRTATTNPPIEELHVLMDLFTKHRVDMVITGHDHEKHTKLFGNTTYITMNAIHDGKKNAAYLQLNIKSGNLDYSFINL